MAEMDRSPSDGNPSDLTPGGAPRTDHAVPASGAITDGDDAFDVRKARAAGWFRALRDEIVAAFEALENSHVPQGAPPTDPLAADAPAADAPAADAPAGRFVLTETHRSGEGRDAGEDHGGGLMSVMRGGRVFEKVGVNVSTVHGTLGDAARQAMTARGVPGLDADPSFWASGISLVAHMVNPHAPAVHMNTRMFWTPGAWWFGGGTDLNPALPYDADTAHFHAVLREACAPHGPDLYDRYKAWADEYFHIPHRKRARGVGGIFYDDRNTGDWEADFALTQDVGRAFLPAFVPLVERRRTTPWTAADRDAQLVHRGLYAEYNLVYDRGTKFGLATGHDPDAVLMSLPPLAKWT